MYKKNFVISIVKLTNSTTHINIQNYSTNNRKLTMSMKTITTTKKKTRFENLINRREKTFFFDFAEIYKK
jgi:hypothetical protein